jgi:hypothetical protein
MMKLVDDTSDRDGIEATCAALEVCRATYYRRRAPEVYWVAQAAHQPRALLPAERRVVLEVLHGVKLPRFGGRFGTIVHAASA